MNLDELKAICDAAPSEPWIASLCEDPRILKIISASSPEEVCEIAACDYRTKVFLVTARTEMPKLIDRIQKLEAALKDARLDFVNPNAKLAEEIDALLAEDK